MLCSLVFSQEFNVLWLNNMSNYLGKRVRDIPDSYKQEIFNKSYYSRELPHEIYEGFSVSNTNFINGIIWVKKSNSRSFLYSEFDKLINILKNYLGDPLIGDPLIEKDDNVWWNWQSKPLVVSIQEGQVGVMVCTLDFVGSTQDEWDRIVKENSRK
jgi:hypothetical protein